MKKIYYLQKHEVKLGDVIEYNGIKAIVTEELIELNPELFSIEEGSYMDLWVYTPSIKKEPFKYRQELEAYKQELLNEAKRDYPVGTVYKPFNVKYMDETEIVKVTKENHHIGTFWVSEDVGNKLAVWVDSGNYFGVVYVNGEWAEIITPKFTSEDGVEIYDKMKTWVVCKDLKLKNHSDYSGAVTDYKYFYYKENALAYIEKHKEKTLEDYENMLLRTNIDSINAREVCWFYHTVKKKEPKLYYTKILQLIADDLNDVRYIHERGQASFHINKKGGVNIHGGDDEGAVYFKSKKLTEKARLILGDNVKYLFN